jgi:Helix-turn-helix domain
MSWRVVKCVLVHHDQKIRGIDLLVLLYLANHASKDDGSGAWPSRQTLADETGVARRTVRYAMVRLVEANALEIEERPGKTHRFRVRMCAGCLPNRGVQELHPAVQEMHGTPAPDAPDSVTEPRSEPPNALGASRRADAAAPARPAGSEQDHPAQNRKAPSPPQATRDGRAEFIERRVEQIRREQGDRAAEAYLAKVAQNDLRDQVRAEVERLSSGVSPDDYGGFVPAWAQETWKAMHPDTSLEGTGS